MDSIRCYNYDAFSLETKFGWMQSGAGANAATGFGRMLAQLSADFAAADANIRAGLRRRGIDGWTGRAAGAATAAIDRSVTVLASHGRRATSGSGAATAYGDSFAATKNAIPEPPRPGVASSLASPTAIQMLQDMPIPGAAAAAVYGVGATAEYVHQLAQYQRADQLANDALRDHEATTRRVLAAFHNAVLDEPAPSATGPGAPNFLAGPPPTVGAPPAVDPPPTAVQPPTTTQPPTNGTPTTTSHQPTATGGLPLPGAAGAFPVFGGARGSDPSGGGMGGSTTGGGVTSGGGPSGHQPSAPPPWAPLPISGAPAEVRPGRTGGSATGRERPGGPGRSPTAPPPRSAAGPVIGERFTDAPYRVATRPPAPRAPGSPVEAAPSPALTTGAAADRSRSGVVPLAPGAGGPTDGRREHRNNYFLPDDSPFRADDDLIGIPPAVIGPEYLCANPTFTDANES